MLRAAELNGLLLSGVLGCTAPGSRLHGPVQLRILHSSDVHSHLFEESILVGQGDAARGLGLLGEGARVGGGARLATALHEARGAQARSVYLDSGDLLEGGPSFPLFQGEPELRLVSALGLSAGALGNHDLSLAPEQLAAAHRAWASFPWLAANYGEASDSPLGRELAPFTILTVQDLVLGVIGVGFPIDAAGRVDGAAAPGLAPLATSAAVQGAIDWLSPSVDLLVALTHQGLDADQALIAATSGLDVVLGGHQHVITNGALSVLDCGARVAAARGCAPRAVTLMHSGAFAHYLGVLDLTLDDRPGRSAGASGVGFEVSSARQTVVPLSAAVPLDIEASGLLEPYQARLDELGFSQPLAFALGEVTRSAAQGGESALGNLVCDALLRRTGADIALISGASLRADLPAGTCARADVARALPFADPVVTTWLSGRELLALLDALAARSAECQAPLQVAGLRLTLECAGALCAGPACSPEARVQVTRQGDPLAPDALYSLATTRYLAEGGSGFELLAGRSSTQLDDTLETALLALLAEYPGCSTSGLPCLDPRQLLDGRLLTRGGG